MKMTIRKLATIEDKIFIQSILTVRSPMMNFYEDIQGLSGFLAIDIIILRRWKIPINPNRWILHMSTI